MRLCEPRHQDEDGLRQVQAAVALLASRSLWDDARGRMAVGALFEGLQV